MPVFDDTDFTMQVVEEHGAPIQARTRHLVRGLSGNGLAMAAEVYGDPSVPQFGDRSPSLPNLILVRRQIEAIPGHTDKCYLHLDWAQAGGPEDGKNFIISGTTTLSQIQSQKDILGNALVVQHTWTNDPDFGSRTDVQGGEVSVFLPQSTVRAQGVWATDHPLLMARTWTGSVNGTFWLGNPPGSWLCSNCTWRPHDLAATPNRWWFEFEFVHNLEGWQPVVWFKDPRTGGPAAGLVPGVGIKSVTWYPQLNYEATPPYILDSLYWR